MSEEKKQEKCNLSLCKEHPEVACEKCKEEESGHNYSFSEALEMIEDGETLSRRGWNGKNMFVFLVKGSTFEVNRAPLNLMFTEGTKITYRPHIDMKAADGTIGVWNPSQDDLLSKDWFVL